MGEHGEHRALVIRTAMTLALALAAMPAQACRLALVLAIDVSNSVDEIEDKLQRSGLANALITDDVRDAFLISPDPVSLLVYEWSGRHHQDVMLEWTEITSAIDLVAAAATIAQSSRVQREFPTAMGHSLGYAATRLREKPECLAKTIDVSADGVNNDGFGPAEAYAAFDFDNVTVNGLVVDASILETRQDMITFFENEVIRGPSAFVEVADGFDTFEETMRRKLIRELLSQMIGNAEPKQTDPHG